MNKMKNVNKLLLLMCCLAIFTSCEDNVNSFPAEDPSSGWVEFVTASTSTGQMPNSVTIPVKINVPVYKDGLVISYTLEGVQGDFSQFVTQTSGTITADPEADTRTATIEIPLINTEIGRDFVTQFDVVLTSTDADMVNIGVDDLSITRHRITLPCSNPTILPDDFFVGEYMVADVVGTIGPNNGTENVASGTYMVSIDPDNPNVRIFNAATVPAFNPALQQFALEFTLDNVVALRDVFTGIGCTAEQFIYSSAGVDNTPWDVCNDQSITINYTEDTNASCGGPYLSSFSMIKVN